MFEVVAVEPKLDGSVELITRQDADNMRLPFNYGWDHWAVYQNGYRIFGSQNFIEVEHTCSALNHTKN